MSKKFIAVLMGSDSDLPVMKATLEILKQFDIAYEVNVKSAHRTPDETIHYVSDAVARGAEIFICAAGLAAHLAGAVAAHSVKPVIGIPLASGSLMGIDALLSTVQMPGGVPVATVAVGSAGAKNAAYLAAQILALSDPELQARLVEDRKNQRAQIEQKNQTLQDALKS